jgi:hypothetical protein
MYEVKVEIGEPFPTKRTSGCLIRMYYDNSSGKEAVSIVSDKYTNTYG